MSDPDQRSKSAGGFLLAMSLMVGTIVGLLLGQPSIGLLAGLAAGSAVALFLWVKGRG